MLQFPTPIPLIGWGGGPRGGGPRGGGPLGGGPNIEISCHSSSYKMLHIIWDVERYYDITMPLDLLCGPEIIW